MYPPAETEKEKKYKTVLFTAIMATIMFVTLWQYQNTMQNRYKNTGIWRGAQQYAEVLLKRNKNLENDWLIGDESWREGNKILSKFALPITLMSMTQKRDVKANISTRFILMMLTATSSNQKAYQRKRLFSRKINKK